MSFILFLGHFIFLFHLFYWTFQLCNCLWIPMVSVQSLKVFCKKASHCYLVNAVLMSQHKNASLRDASFSLHAFYFFPVGFLFLFDLCCHRLTHAHPLCRQEIQGLYLWWYKPQWWTETDRFQAVEGGGLWHRKAKFYSLLKAKA